MGGRISECSRSSAKTTARIFPHFLLFLLWITDSYLNSPRNLHQMEMEKNVLEKKESHNDFYLHNGTERKHLGFGTGAIYSTLTSNPDRKNKPPNGRLDRRCMIFLCLLLSGDIQLNPGPVFKSFTSEKHFVDRHQPDLIQRVKMVDPILDLLLADDVITDEGYSNVRSKSTTQEKMRELYPLLNSSKAKDMFYKGLEVHEKLLLNDIRDAQPSHPTQPERAAASSVSGEVGGRMDSDAVPKVEKNEAPPEFDDDYLREAEKNLTKEERWSRRLESLALKEKGNGRFKAAEHREAERSYTEALAVCPVCFSSDRAVLFSNRAASRVHLDLKDQAIADWSRAVELNPDYVRAILRRAELYEKTDKLDEALRDYKTVLEKEPGQNAAREACVRLPRQIHDRDEKMGSPLKKGDKKDIWTWALYKVQIPVTCGDKEGMLNRAKLAKGEKCIVVQNQWFTPPAFEEFAGRKASKNWKLTIRCQNTSLSKLLKGGYLTCLGYNEGATKTRKSLIPPQSINSDRAPSRSSGAGPHHHLRPTPSSPELYQETLDSDTREYRVVYEVPDTPPAVQTPPRYSHAAGMASAINIPPNSSLRYPQQQYLSPASTSDSPPNSGEGDQERSRDEEPGCSHDTGDKRVFNVSVESSDRPDPATMMIPRTLSTYQGRN